MIKCVDCRFNVAGLCYRFPPQPALTNFSSEQQTVIWPKINIVGCGEGLPIGEPEIPPSEQFLFTEDFENEWFIDNTFATIYEELFESVWEIDNNYTQIFSEDFEGVWI